MNARTAQAQTYRQTALEQSATGPAALRPGAATLDAKARRQAAGPKGLAQLVARLRLAWDPLGAPLRLLDTYGDLVKVSPRRYLTRHPAVVEAVMGDDLRFSQAAAWDYSEAAVTFWGNSRHIKSAAAWQRQRRLMQPAYNPARIAAYSETVVTHTHCMLDGWQDGDSFDLHDRLQHLTLGLIIENVLGAQLSNVDVEQIIEALDAAHPLFAGSDRLQHAFDTPQQQRRLRESVKRLDAIVYRVIAQRRADPKDRGDMLWAWIASADEAG